MKRRRFLTISAGLVGLALLPAARRAGAAPLRVWRGQALGAQSQIAMAHPDAERLIAAARAEINRLENIFSLYRTDSALSRLNRCGRLDDPPFELLDCLSLCGRVHRASGGLFDPTIQPLWAAYAEAYAQGRVPDDKARALVGWDGVQFDTRAIRLTRPGMALTLNGVAQGVIADRVADMLRDFRLMDVLIDTGEIAARGAPPDAAAWPVTIHGGPRLQLLGGQALATSASRGTVFDSEGRIGHILDPRNGALARPAFAQISVTAESASLADALSTASCLMPDTAVLERFISTFPNASLSEIRHA